MFNDELTLPQCEVLIGRLAECAFPFQCAHGRPSIVPLVDLGALGRMMSKRVRKERGEREMDSRAAMRTWVNMKRKEKTAEEVIDEG